jgi:error-prone DNA polymerase
MAAWRRSGRIERHRERLVSRMKQKGIAEEFAERVFQQIRGFGDYGFPEAHAASFALIAYATAWLKCHYPAEFCCALLDAQPMGFYSPATIVEDAKRHGVEVRPIDVAVSAWDCTIEGPLPDPPPTGGREGRGEPAVRMGLRYVKGLGERDRARIEAARAAGPFSSIADFVRRTGLDDRRQSLLAEAGAFGSFGSGRRTALWQVKGWMAAQGDALPVRPEDAAPAFDELTALETILWDYRTSDHSPRGHPLAPLRDRLRAQRLPDARAVHRMRDGQRVRYAGIVICRQRPGTASGVTFMTLEDETGFVNAVVWRQVFDRFALLLRTTSFLGITGRLQVQQGVVHVIVDDCWHPHLDAEPARPRSRDFH